MIGSSPDSPAHAAGGAGSAPSAHPPAIPDHELLRKIGEGSYGEVWLARHTRLGALRAVKVIRRDQFDNDRPFQREFDGIRRYEPISRGHPNLVSILHVGGTDACFFYVMELADSVSRFEFRVSSSTPTVPAEAQLETRNPKPETYLPHTLRAELKCHGALPIDRCLEIGLALAGALAHLHARGLVHRDVKPSNIIFVGGVAKLADIGLVAAVSDSRSFVGTEGYIPPEDPGTPSADCYALGKLLYELSTGHDRTAWPEPPADLPTRPDRERLLELNAILHKACAAEVGQRYQSGEEMHHELGLLQRGESVKRQRAVGQRFALIKSIAVVAAGLVLLVTAGHLLSKRLSWRSADRESFSVAPTASELKSIAVLPFDNDSPNKADEYLGSQMAEELSGALTKAPELQVTGRSTAAKLKSVTDLRQSANELNVHAVLSGRVRKAGTRFRVTAELTRPAKDLLLWSEVYDRELSEIFGIQSDIAQKVAEKLGVRLTETMRQRLALASTRNLEAHRLYLEGRFHWYKRTKPGLSNALECFHKAIAHDPQFARAHAGLADVYTLLPEYINAPPEKSFLKAKSAAAQALALDSTLAEAHTTLGSIKAEFDWDWRGAKSDFERAIELSPNYPTAHHWYSMLLESQGRHGDALREARLALDLDPLSAVLNSSLGVRLFYAARYQEAILQLRRTLELDDRSASTHHRLGWAHERIGDYEQAVAEWEQANRLWGIRPENLAALRTAFVDSGITGYLRKQAEQWERRAERRDFPPYPIAVLRARLGEREETLKWLQQAAQERSSGLSFLKVEPVFESLRSDSLFKEILRKMGLDR